jgi:hypothetical protein
MSSADLGGHSSVPLDESMNLKAVLGPLADDDQGGDTVIATVVVSRVPLGLGLHSEQR